MEDPIGEGWLAVVLGVLHVSHEWGGLATLVEDDASAHHAEEPDDGGDAIDGARLRTVHDPVHQEGDAR